MILRDESGKKQNTARQQLGLDIILHHRPSYSRNS